jgi:HAD superfamily hydrolase (TIGR01484 family)
VKPVSALPLAEARALSGLFFDLDDTLLDHGRLTRVAYDALWRLADAGLALVAVTGRPCGWGEVLVRQWPVDGCVAENGAIEIVRQGKGVAVLDACGERERSDRRERLARIVALVRDAVPRAALADDVGARRTDVTWDIGERATLPEEDVRAIVRVVEGAAARWSRSSVHLHATFDADDKASGALRFGARRLGVEPGAAASRFAFVGDSTNDAPCFAAFRTTFGVANVRTSVPRLSVPPRYVANHAMGAGFAEVADAILRRA